MTDDPPDNCSAGPKGDNLYEWVATLIGPANTPYANGVFFLSIQIPPEYPFNPPTITFRTRIYHCNINSKGQLCIPSLSTTWTPTLTIRTLLTFVHALLIQPNPHDPLVGSIGVQYLTNRDEHDNTAKDWMNRFAS